MLAEEIAIGEARAEAGAESRFIGRGRIEADRTICVEERAVVAIDESVPIVGPHQTAKWRYHELDRELGDEQRTATDAAKHRIAWINVVDSTALSAGRWRGG